MTAKKRITKSARKATKRAPKSSGRAKAKTPSKRTSKASSDYQAGWRAASDSARSDKERIKAFAGLANAICDDPTVFRGMIDVLRDGTNSLPVRMAALAALQAATFQSVKFSKYRPTYMAALRAVSTDPELELRKRVLGLLSRQEDAATQELLIKGLKDPSKALVAPEKALQLLSYYLKGEGYPIARQILAQPSSPEAKREALRLLGGDSKSVGLFERVLLDKAASSEMRQISASALQALAPDKLQAHARRIVLDPAESADLQATSLTALADFGKDEDLAKDVELNQRVDSLQAAAATESIKQSTKQFVERYR